jgi:plasmid stabilization system protein ParE
VSVRLLRSARVEFVHAIKWYEEREPGLGDEFLVEVDRALELVGANPEAWPLWPGEPRARRFVMRRFPYVIAYREGLGEVTIVAFVHAKRRPGYWRDRLDET